MSAMRSRAKEHFPMVLLTLLSIVQALALELLWSHIIESDYLFERPWDAMIVWLQIACTFIGLILIWVVYAANAMRFRWVPVTVDSVYPFIIGVLEFMMVETLEPGETGQWLILMAVIFSVMVRVNHMTMRRARQDTDNELFFSGFSPARTRDFMPHIAIAAAMIAAGAYTLLAGERGTFVLLAVLATLGVLVWQFYMTAVLWRRSVAQMDSESEG